MPASPDRASWPRLPNTPDPAPAIAIRRRADLSLRENPLAEAASDLTVKPSLAFGANLDGLFKAGLADEEILETVRIVAIFNATGRPNADIGVKTGGGSHDAFRGA